MTLGELGKAVLHTAANNIHKRFHIDYHTAEDIASEAAAYALKGILESGSPVEKNEWRNKTIWKARNLAKDWIKQHADPDELLILDQPYVDENGKESEGSPALVKVAMQRFATATACELEEKENDRNASISIRTKIVWRKRFVRENYAPRSANIFIDYVFNRIPIADICKKFDTSPNTVSVTVSRINADLTLEELIGKAKRTGSRLPSTNFREPVWRAGRRYVHKEKSNPIRHSSDPEVIYGKDVWKKYLANEAEINEKANYISHEKLRRLREENFEWLKKNARR